MHQIKDFSCIDNLIINPEQIIIGDTLRKTDIYICASMYESFCFTSTRSINFVDVLLLQQIMVE